MLPTVLFRHWVKSIIIATLSLVLLNNNLFGQIPAGYYDPASGLSGEALKTALNDIISGHTVYPYTSTSTDVWDILKESDRDPNNSSNVILLYTGWSVDAAQEYNSGSGWTREHCWPKSHGFPSESQPAYTDCHHLRPADVSVNSARNSRWYGECNEEYYDAGGTIPTGSYTSSTDWVWKPRDEVKGDAARMIFYMATRYEGEYNSVEGITEIDLEIVDYIPADNYSSLPEMAVLSDLLAWHLEDPVDDFERNRNEVVYGYQGNRNPFVDHPEYVNLIWGDCTPPSTQATNFSSNTVTENSMNISFTRGDGDGGVLVLAKSGSAVDSDPISGTTYSASSTFGSGDEVGSGNFVVYNGSANGINSASGNIPVSGLAQGVTYHFAIYEYNLTDICVNTEELTGSETTIMNCNTPTIHASSMIVSDLTTSSMNLSWTSGDGESRIVIMNTANSYTELADGSDPLANATYTSGEQVVYNGTENSVSIDGLTADTEYYIWVFEKNCSGVFTKYFTSSPPEVTVLTPSSNGTASVDVLWSEDFETDGHLTRYVASSSGGFNDGIHDHFNRTDGSDISNISGDYTGINGSYFWAAEDTDDDGGDGSDVQTISFTNIDISGYSDLSFSGYFGAGNENLPGASAYDAPDYIKVTYSIDGGAVQNGIWFSYERVGDNFNEPLGLDADFDGQSDVNGVNRLGTALQEFTFNIATGSTLDITIEVYMDSDKEEIAFDNLKLTGTSGSIYTNKNTDHFRSFTNGEFSNASIWQTADVNAPDIWYVSALAPDENAASITISANNNVTLGSSLIVSSLNIESGGSLSFSSDSQTLSVLGDISIDASGMLDLSQTGSTLLLNGSSKQTISFNGSVNIYNLNLNNSAGADLTNNLTIENQLTFTTGKIFASSYTVTIENASESAIAGYNSSNYVIGNLKRKVNSTGSYVFPIGSSLNYEFAQVDLNTSSGINYLNAVFSSSISGDAPSISTRSTVINTLLNSGIWTISPDAVTTVNYDVTLISVGHDNGGAAVSQHTILKRDNSSSDWDLYGSSAIADQSGTGAEPITVKRTGLTGFSEFGGGVADNPLPVELAYFRGTLTDNGIYLEWKTLTEINNDYFIVEKSLNGCDFNECVEIQGHGNSNVPIEYQFLDNQPVIGDNYYRFKQVDFDGNYQYSQVIGVINDFANSIELFYNNGLLVYRLSKPESFKVSIFNYAGQLVSTLTVSTENIHGKLDIELPRSGLYIAKFEGLRWIKSIKFLQE